MVNYHMALHEEDDPQWLREAELRLTVARDNLGTLLKVSRPSKTHFA